MIDNYAALLRQTAKAYRESLAAPDTDDMFTLAYQWQDKKHRHVWDLCKELERAADRIEKLEAALRDCMETAEVHEIPFRERVMNISGIARKALDDAP